MKKIISLLLCATLFLIMFNINVCANEKKTLKVLAIGNSYSNNTTEYVSKIAESMGISIEATSLYYPGCSIKQHVTKYENDIADYVLFVDGKSDWQYLTLKEALTTKEYDIITLQDSPPAVNFSSFYTKEDPLIEKLYGYVKQHQPNAKIMLHETWAYCTEAIRGGSDYTKVYYESNADMQKVLSENYKKAADLLGGLDVIPFGKAVNIAVDNFSYGESYNDKDSVYDDNISHLSKIGRYLAGCVWVEFLTGADVRNATFDAYIETAPLLREIAHEAVTGEQDTIKDNFRVFEYNGGYKIYKDNRPVNEDGVVDIPSKIDGKTVFCISESIFEGKTGIKVVNVPRCVTLIETGAFGNAKINFVEAEKENNNKIIVVCVIFASALLLCVGALVLLKRLKKAQK